MGQATRRKASTWHKLAVTARNLFSKSLNRQVVGEGVGGEPVSVSQGEALAYALAVDDSNPRYFQKEGAVVTPLFAARIAGEVLEKVILHDRLGMNAFKMVHAEQAFRFHKPILAGMEVIPTGKIAAIREVSSGEILEMTLEIRAGGELLTEGVTSLFVKTPSKGKDKGDKGEKKEKDRKEVPLLEPVAAFEVALGQPGRYALASGDYNPIHTRKWAAKLAGFKAPIAHGMCVLAMTAARLTSLYGGDDPARLASLTARFSKPAYPGQELTLKTQVDGQTVRFILENPKGKPILSRGEAVFR
jgi:acyl dehydratase